MQVIYMDKKNKTKVVNPMWGGRFSSSPSQTMHEFNASINFDWHIFLGSLIFFILCGILIFQNKIWEEEDYSRNKKWLKWKASAIKANKGDLSGIYPTSKK